MCLTEGTKFEKLGNHYTSTTPNHPSIQSPSYPSTTTPCHPCTRSIKRINHLYKHWWAEQYTRYGLTSYSYELHTNRNKHKTRQCWVVPQPGEGISASGDRLGVTHWLYRRGCGSKCVNGQTRSALYLPPAGGSNRSVAWCVTHVVVGRITCTQVICELA